MKKESQRKRIRFIEEDRNKLIQEAYCQFIRSCRVKNLSEATITYYETYMKQFQKYILNCAITKTSQIKQEVVEGYILSLKGKCKDISINTNLRAVRAIVYYFQSKGYTTRFEIKLPKVDKELKETYSKEELLKLLEKPKNKNFTEYRTWTMENFAIGTGARLGEMLNIRILDINFEEALVTVNGKGRHERHVPISQTLYNVLREYILYRNAEKDDEFLFCNCFGGFLKENSAKQCIANYNLKRGVNKTSIHLFRHTFAKYWIMNGGDSFRLQKILGHKSIEIVKEYIAIFTIDLQKDYEGLCPLEQITNYRKRTKIKVAKK